MLGKQLPQTLGTVHGTHLCASAPGSVSLLPPCPHHPAVGTARPVNKAASGRLLPVVTEIWERFRFLFCENVHPQSSGVGWLRQCGRHLPLLADSQCRLGSEPYPVPAHLVSHGPVNPEPKAGPALCSWNLKAGDTGRGRFMGSKCRAQMACEHLVPLGCLSRDLLPVGSP